MKGTIIWTVICLSAIAAITGLVRADDVTADILYEKGLSDFEKKDYKAAETAFIKALEASPGHLKGLVKLAEICEMDDKRQAEAIEYYSRAKEILDGKEKPTADEKKMKTAVDKKLEQLDKLGSEYKTERANYVKNLIGIANDAKKDKRYDLALKIYCEILAIDQKNSEASRGKKEMEILLDKPSDKKDKDKDKDKDKGKDKDKPKDKDKDKVPAGRDDTAVWGEEKALFNGEDIKDWTKENGSWNVEDGEITSPSRKGASSILVHEEKYDADKISLSTEFEAEFSDSRDSTPSAGVVFGFSSLQEPFYTVRTNEDTLLVTRCEPEQKNGALVHTHLVICQAKQSAYDNDGWNTLKIEVNDEELTVYLNDKKCISEEEIDKLDGRKVGLMVFSGSIRVRNVSVKEGR